ncbi:MAG: tripartite tricarboxylate transporter substrate binding protein [Burkholderiales bacterium]
MGKAIASIMRTAAFAVALAAACAAHAQPVVKVVVNGPPGGLFDIVLRAISERLDKELGATVVIDNKPGAGGAVALGVVKNAKPDGLTLGMINVTAAASETILRNKDYNLLTDFEPIGLYAFPANVLIVNPGIPATTVPQLVEMLQKSGEGVSYSSGGVGSPGQLAGEMFKSRTGARAVHVPYKGAPPAVLAVVTGEVAYMFATASSAVGQINAQKVRALAVTTQERLPALPDVPTLAEAGLVDFKVTDWVGFVAPKGTPPAVRDRLHAALAAAFADPVARDRLVKATFIPAAKPLSPQEFATFLRAEVTKWGKVAKEANIQQD